MSWFLLFIAGLLEVSWVSILKFQGSQFKPITLVLLFCILVSIPLILSFVFRSIPISTAYPIWIGMAVLGTTLVGGFLFGESISPLRIIFIILLIISISGLKITAPNGFEKTYRKTNEN